MRNLKVDGIVLKRRNAGEADRILTVFTRQFGKLSIKAVGVRKIVSRRASHIEPLNITTLGLYKGQGMHILTEATCVDSFDAVKSDLAKVGLAYHMCELVDALCPENQEHTAVFELLYQTLQQLSQVNESMPLIHEFELELLSLLGYYSAGSHDLSGAKASYFIESILERKLKSRQILRQLL